MKIERRKTTECREKMSKWNGERKNISYVSRAVAQLHRKWTKARVDLTLQIKAKPEGVIDIFYRYNKMDMDPGELQREGGIVAVDLWSKTVDAYDRILKEAQEKVSIAMEMFDSMKEMFQCEVQKVTKAVRERGDGIILLHEVI